METELIKIILQGGSYGLLAAGLITVWLRYQDALKAKDELHASHAKEKDVLHTKQADAQQKLIDLLLSKVEK